MTKKMETIHSYDIHTTYGGEIDINDFNTSSPNKNRIDKYVEAAQFNKKLKRNRLEKEEMKKYKDFTLEELREMKLVSNTNGRPTSYLTDEKWQKEFRLRKMFIKPYPDNIKRMGGRFSRKTSQRNEETQGIYHGGTNYQDYCTYINDVLSTIRGGKVDYCYFIYQILDLLKFHHDDLQTKYCDGYWEVWLER